MNLLWQLGVLVSLMLGSQLFGMQEEFREVSRTYGQYIAEFVSRLTHEQYKQLVLHPYFFDNPCELLESTFVQELTEEQKMLFLKVAREYNSDTWSDFKELVLKNLFAFSALTPEALKDLQINQISVEQFDAPWNKRIQEFIKNDKKIKEFTWNLLERSWCPIDSQDLCSSTLSLFKEDEMVEEIQTSFQNKLSPGWWQWTWQKCSAVKEWWYSDQSELRDQQWLIKFGSLFSKLKREQRWFLIDIIQILQGYKNILLDDAYNSKLITVALSMFSNQRDYLRAVCYWYLEAFVFQRLLEYGYCKPHERELFAKSFKDKFDEHIMHLNEQEQARAHNIRRVCKIVLLY